MRRIPFKYQSTLDYFKLIFSLRERKENLV